jgi:hypothetical protein
MIARRGGGMEGSTLNPVRRGRAPFTVTHVLAVVCLLVSGSGSDCKGIAVGKAAGSAGSTQSPLIAQSSKDTSVLASGLYLGPWNDGSGTHWLALFVDAVPKGITYDPPRVRALCSLSFDHGAVAFTTGKMTYSVGGRHPLAFRGVWNGGGIEGTLSMFAIGGARVVSTRLTHYALDYVGQELTGIYTAVSYHGETGDLTGDELLLFKSGGKLMGLYTSYEGGPDGPFPAESVRTAGDTVTFSTVGYATQQRTPRVFVLVADSTHSNGGGIPRRLAKRATISEFLSPSSAEPCTTNSPPRRGQ